MKLPLLSLLSLLTLPVIGEPRYLTVTTNTVLTLKAGEALEAVSGYGGGISLQVAEGLTSPFWQFTGIGANPSAEPAQNLPAVAGPMKVVIWFPPPNPNYGMYCTVRLLPNFVDPSRTLVLAPTTNAVTVHLESSTNLVDWSQSASVTLTNVPTATFYRARVE